jgi:predicted phage tail component-like protein
MIKFAGKSLPVYAKVTDIKYSILPPVNQKTEGIYGRAGVYDFGIELGERKIEVEVMLIADSPNDVMLKARDFATFLFYKDLQPLILLDDSGRQYMARVSGDTDISELYRTGTATIVFSCPSAYAEDINEKVVTAKPTTTDPVSVVNNGSVETYPVIELTMTKESETLAVISDDGYVALGDSDAEKTPTKLKSLVLSDGMKSYTGWTTASSVDNGVISGTLYSTGESVRQTGGAYGNTSANRRWSGASAIKALSRTITDFNVEARVGFHVTKPEQIGRVELYLLDANNVQIGKIALVNSTSNVNHPRLEARAGSLGYGYYFQKESALKRPFNKMVGGHADPMTIKISRKGKVWSVYQSVRYVDGKNSWSVTKTWIDSRSAYGTAPLAKIQIHIGAYYKYAPVNTMYIADLKVYDIGTAATSTQSEIVYEIGDVITIDNSKAVVLRNGDPIFTELDPASNFFKLEKGANGLIVSPPVADLKVTYRERWL